MYTVYYLHRLPYFRTHPAVHLPSSVSVDTYIAVLRMDSSCKLSAVYTRTAHDAFDTGIRQISS